MATALNFKPKCDRCETYQQGVFCLVLSYFNRQLICESCERKEQAHSNYTKARTAELNAVRAGNFNFPGIGLPESLKC